MLSPSLNLPLARDWTPSSVLLASLLLLVPEILPARDPTVPFVFGWSAPKPTQAADAGYPHLPGVEVIHLLRDQKEKMHHLPILQRIQNHFYVMTTHHPKSPHESAQGRNCRAWISDETGRTWKGPFEILPPPDKVSGTLLRSLPGKNPIGFPSRFVESEVDGKIYGVSRIGYKIWSTGSEDNRAGHYTVGFLGREVGPAGLLSAPFWVLRKEDTNSFSRLQYEDRSHTPLGRELGDIAFDWIPAGGALSPQGIRYPKPWRQTAPDGISLTEFTTGWVGDRAVALGRPDSNERKVLYHYMAWSEDRGQTWSPFQRTPIPTAQNGSHLGTLPDGRLYLVGALSPNRLHRRTPLAIAVSSDGRSFDRAYAVFVAKIHAVRNTVIHDGFIWLAITHGGRENNGRQDVAVVKIPIAELD